MASHSRALLLGLFLGLAPSTALAFEDDLDFDDDFFEEVSRQRRVHADADELPDIDPMDEEIDEDRVGCTVDPTYRRPRRTRPR